MTAECFTCGFPTLRRGGHAAWCWSENPALPNVDGEASPTKRAWRPRGAGEMSPLGLTLDKPGQGEVGLEFWPLCDRETPSCSLHGAMNRVAAGPLWRCLSCNIGVEWPLAFASSRADTGPASGAARFDGAAGSKPKSSWASGTCTAPAAPHRHQPAAGDAISDGPGRRETATGPTGDAQ